MRLVCGLEFACNKISFSHQGTIMLCVPLKQFPFEYVPNFLIERQTGYTLTKLHSDRSLIRVSDDSTVVQWTSGRLKTKVPGSILN